MTNKIMYEKPHATVVKVDMGDSLCIVTGTTSEEGEKALSKENNGSLWDDDETKGTENTTNSIWDK